jgi:UDP-glucose 4-epimerase
MKIGVTGGAGYIGSTLVINLIKQGDKVVSIDNQMIGDYKYLANHPIGNKAKRIEGDIRDLDLLVEIWKNCDAVAHLAALPGLVLCNEKPEEAVSVNVFGTYQVMEAARKLDINRVVFCSSAATYGIPSIMPVTEEHPQRPINLYGVTKVSGEQVINTYSDNYGIETVNLRFGNIFGVGLYTRWNTVIPKFVNQAINGEKITIYGDGEYSRDFVHVQDITKAMMLSLVTPTVGGEAFNVGGETLTVNQIAALTKEEVKKITGGEAEAINTPPRKGETKKFSYDLSKIRSKLGFINNWSVKEGVKQLINYRLETLARQPDTL